MKQIVQTGAESVDVQEAPVPEPGPDEVLVKVHSAGLCGSDAHAYRYDKGYEWIPIPRVMGHEYSGTVHEVGANVTAFAAGDVVVEEPIHECGECFQCRNGEENVCQNFSITGMHRDGAYAEYTLVDPDHLHAIPDGVSLREAALTEPTSIATRAVLVQSSMTPGDDVLVEGPGPIGSLTAVVAQQTGANVVVSGLGKDGDARLPIVEDMGIDTVNVDQVSLSEVADRRTDGRGFDVVFDTTGYHTGLTMGVDVVRKGGEILVVGLPADPSELFMTPIVRGEITVNTSYGSKWSDFETALRLMANGTIDAGSIIDTSFSIDDPTGAFESFLNSEVIKPVFSFAD